MGNLATVEIESDGGELAGRLLGQLLLQVETLGDAQFAVPIFQAAAAYALWHGDLVDARRAVARAWEMTRVTEDWALAATWFRRAKKEGSDSSEVKRCKNTPSRWLSFIHLKCRTTVFCLNAE